MLGVSLRTLMFDLKGDEFDFFVILEKFPKSKLVSVI